LDVNEEKKNDQIWTDEDLLVLESLALACNEEMLKDLVETGNIPRVRAIKALIETGNKSIEKAIKWLELNDEDPNIDGPIKIINETEDEVGLFCVFSTLMSVAF